MKETLFNVFLRILKDLFDVENQLVAALPQLIQVASRTELKDALRNHLDETRNQVQRLKKIFKMLNESPTGIPCKPMQALIDDAREVISVGDPSASKDAAIIIAGQKVEHYEIASYGSARTIAQHLTNLDTHPNVDFDEIADLLQTSLDEEIAADEKLTDIAEGGFFTTGVNVEATEETKRRGL